MGRSVKARFFIMDIRLSLCLDEFLEAGLIVPIDPIRGQFRDLVDEDLVRRSLTFSYPASR